MKKIVMAVMMFCMACSVFAQIAPADDNSRQAIYGALDQAKSSLAAAPFAGKNVAILPISGDKNALIAGRLKNMLTEAKFNCVEGKEDPMWDEIMKEIAWDERKEDILDPATVAKFGKLQAAQILVYGKLRVLDKNADRIYAEIELHATDIVTKKHVWGGSFAFRFYQGKDMRGIISLDTDLRLLLKKNFEEAKKSLLEPANAAKFDKNKTVTVVPLAGDIDNYMTGLAIEMLTGTALLPKNPQIPSLSQIRAFVRDGQLESDHVFYGAIRDLYRGPTASKLILDEDSKPAIRETTDVHADIQLFVEDVRSGVVLWSKTITLQESVVKVRDLNAAEMQDWQANEAARIAAIKAEQAAAEKKAARELKKQEEKAAVEQAKKDAADKAQAEDDQKKFYSILIASIVGFVALLLFIIWCIKARASYRDVR